MDNKNDTGYQTINFYFQEKAPTKYSPILGVGDMDNIPNSNESNTTIPKVHKVDIGSNLSISNEGMVESEDVVGKMQKIDSLSESVELLINLHLSEIPSRGEEVEEVGRRLGDGEWVLLSNPTEEDPQLRN